MQPKVSSFNMWKCLKRGIIIVRCPVSSLSMCVPSLKIDLFPHPFSKFQQHIGLSIIDNLFKMTLLINNLHKTKLCLGQTKCKMDLVKRAKANLALPGKTERLGSASQSKWKITLQLKKNLKILIWQHFSHLSYHNQMLKSFPKAKSDHSYPRRVYSGMGRT